MEIVILIISAKMAWFVVMIIAIAALVTQRMIVVKIQMHLVSNTTLKIHYPKNQNQQSVMEKIINYKYILNISLDNICSISQKQLLNFSSIVLSKVRNMWLGIECPGNLFLKHTYFQILGRLIHYDKYVLKCFLSLLRSYEIHCGNRISFQQWN